MKKEVTICDICGQEIKREAPVIKDFKVFEYRLNFPEKYYSISAIAEIGRTKKDICLNCINEAMNKAIIELFK